VPAHLAEVWADRDLSVQAHRAAYAGLAATVDADLADALYERLLIADGWQLYADTIPTLQALRARGVPVAVVSNIGFDLRDLAAQLGLADLVDEFVLSYEVGRCKPDPAIFWKACAALRTDPEHTLMVGDTPSDAGAAAAGCSVLVLPESDPGKIHGLGAVLRLL
jgi:HAD superfamily hydrolase (TIGR01509 family)